MKVWTCTSAAPTCDGSCIGEDSDAQADDIAPRTAALVYARDRGKDVLAVHTEQTFLRGPRLGTHRKRFVVRKMTIYRIDGELLDS